MKKITKLFYQIFFLFLLNIGLIEGQNVWTKMADFPGVARINTVSFTIGHYAFVGLGNNGSTTYNDMYKWNQKTNVWTKIADYPGGGNLAPIAFAINGKG
ncbi:MAG: hypothetical protein JNL63_00400, partial [Bacteroidia bacterium]|nr:hypothetical protein [Bacteroidia bacterium]